MSIAETIWKQISVSTKMACGCRFPVSDENSLTFQVTITPRVCHKIVVTLDPNDTYSVKLVRIRGVNVVEEEVYEDIYCDQLSEIIYRMCNK